MNESILAEELSSLLEAHVPLLRAESKLSGPKWRAPWQDELRSTVDWESAPLFKVGSQQSAIIQTGMSGSGGFTTGREEFGGMVFLLVVEALGDDAEAIEAVGAAWPTEARRGVPQSAWKSRVREARSRERGSGSEEVVEETTIDELSSTDEPPSTDRSVTAPEGERAPPRKLSKGKAKKLIAEVAKARAGGATALKELVREVVLAIEGMDIPEGEAPPVRAPQRTQDDSSVGLSPPKQLLGRRRTHSVAVPSLSALRRDMHSGGPSLIEEPGGTPKSIALGGTQQVLPVTQDPSEVSSTEPEGTSLVGVGKRASKPETSSKATTQRGGSEAPTSPPTKSRSESTTEARGGSTTEARSGSTTEAPTRPPTKARSEPTKHGGTTRARSQSSPGVRQPRATSTLSREEQTRALREGRTSQGSGSGTTGAGLKGTEEATKGEAPKGEAGKGEAGKGEAGKGEAGKSGVTAPPKGPKVSAMRPKGWVVRELPETTGDDFLRQVEAHKAKPRGRKAMRSFFHKTARGALARASVMGPGASKVASALLPWAKQMPPDLGSERSSKTAQLPSPEGRTLVTKSAGVEESTDAPSRPAPLGQRDETRQRQASAQRARVEKQTAQQQKAVEKQTAQQQKAVEKQTAQQRKAVERQTAQQQKAVEKQTAQGQQTGEERTGEEQPPQERESATPFTGRSRSDAVHRSPSEQEAEDLATKKRELEELEAKVAVQDAFMSSVLKHSTRRAPKTLSGARKLGWDESRQRLDEEIQENVKSKARRLGLGLRGFRMLTSLLTSPNLKGDTQLTLEAPVLGRGTTESRTQALTPPTDLVTTPGTESEQGSDTSIAPVSETTASLGKADPPRSSESSKASPPTDKGTIAPDTTTERGELSESPPLPTPTTVQGTDGDKVLVSGKKVDGTTGTEEASETSSTTAPTTAGKPPIGSKTPKTQAVPSSALTKKPKSTFVANPLLVGAPDHFLEHLRATSFKRSRGVFGRARAALADIDPRARKKKRTKDAAVAQLAQAAQSRQELIVHPRTPEQHAGQSTLGGIEARTAAPRTETTDTGPLEGQGSTISAPSEKKEGGTIRQQIAAIRRNRAEKGEDVSAPIHFELTGAGFTPLAGKAGPKPPGPEQAKKTEPAPPRPPLKPPPDPPEPTDAKKERDQRRPRGQSLPRDWSAPEALLNRGSQPEQVVSIDRTAPPQTGLESLAADEMITLLRKLARGDSDARRALVEIRRELARMDRASNGRQYR